MKLLDTVIIVGTLVGVLATGVYFAKIMPTQAQIKQTILK